MLNLEIKTKDNHNKPVTFTEELTQEDYDIFHAVTRNTLTPQQEEQIVTVEKNYPRQKSVLAVHWHPEHVPMDLIRKRIETTFPNAGQQLIIPTQHNELESYDGVFSGVEVDCYSKQFDQKVQLLCHFEKTKAEQATVFRHMIEHTFKYRSSQLENLLNALTDTNNETCLQIAAKEHNASREQIDFARIIATKIKKLIDEFHSDIAPSMLKNKLIRNFIDELRPVLGNDFVDQSQFLVQSVKQLVKKSFNPEYFYETREIIEEVKNAGGRIVIPHPEQFWPILIAGYDIDGIEVWNPQSKRYTDFLVDVLRGQNAHRPKGTPPILIFMGDDCHMGEKTKDPDKQDKAKVAREIGVQDAWDELDVRKNLMLAEASRESIIKEYTARLKG